MTSKSKENKKEVKWKTISNHKWDNDEYYNDAVQYLQTRNYDKKNQHWPKYLRNDSNKIMENIKRKARYEFKEKMKYYDLDEKNRIIVRNINFDREQLVYKPDSKEILHYVIKPSQKEHIIKHIIEGKDMETIALNSLSIYKRLVNNYKIANILYE